MDEDDAAGPSLCCKGAHRQRFVRVIHFRSFPAFYKAKTVWSLYCLYRTIIFLMSTSRGVPRGASKKVVRRSQAAHRAGGHPETAIKTFQGWPPAGRRGVGHGKNEKASLS
jgi:hypothetical protein